MSVLNPDLNETTSNAVMWQHFDGIIDDVVEYISECLQYMSFSSIGISWEYAGIDRLMTYYVQLGPYSLKSDIRKQIISSFNLFKTEAAFYTKCFNICYLKSVTCLNSKFKF